MRHWHQAAVARPLPAVGSDGDRQCSDHCRPSVAAETDAGGPPLVPSGYAFPAARCTHAAFPTPSLWHRSFAASIVPGQHRGPRAVSRAAPALLALLYVHAATPLPCGIRCLRVCSLACTQVCSRRSCCRHCPHLCARSLRCLRHVPSLDHLLLLPPSRACRRCRCILGRSSPRPPLHLRHCACSLARRCNSRRCRCSYHCCSH